MRICLGEFTEEKVHVIIRRMDTGCMLKTK
jgi:hypothetical protein